MAFGQQMGSLKNLKKSMAKGSGGAFIKYIPKNGSMNVRFIQEPENWVNYIEHFDPVARKSFPCNGEQNCPGCASGERKSSRYLANAVDRDDKDRVIPLQLPKDLANRLVIRYERNGTLIDRDFELSRAGEGLDTVYDLDAGPVDRAKIDKFKPLDLLKVLEDAFNNVFGGDDDDDDDDDDQPAPKVTKTRKRSGAAAAARTEAPEPDEDEPEVDEEDDEEPEETPKPKSRKKKAAAPEPEFTPEVDEDDDEDEDDAEPDEDEPDVDEDDDDEDEGYTEEVLRAMPMGVLRKVARDEFGVSTRGKDQDALIDAIFEAGEADDDD